MLTEQVKYLDESLHLNVQDLSNQLDYASQSLEKQLDEYAKRLGNLSEQINPLNLGL